METTKLLIGLEIHITLNSQKKIFNWGNTYQQGSIPPNSQVSPWELGYLGSLPIINLETIQLALKLATALQMKISPIILFDRKLYHYFDLPKGYQITQFHQPLATEGCFFLINSAAEKITLRNLQLEEDTAKSFYTEGEIQLDFNRSGNPLIELTTDPVFQKVDQVITFLEQLQILLKYLDISEARMEKGQLRIDLNFSLCLENYQTPRYEIKNLNSLNNLEKALQYEINKHWELTQKKLSPPPSQTLGFDEKEKSTFIQRTKTNYSYLPEVNIPPIKIKKREIKKVKNNLPCLPWEWYERLITNKEIKKNNAILITKSSSLMKVFGWLETKKKLQLEEINDWTVFLLNYLLPSLSVEENTDFFRTRWSTYYQLFQNWKKREINKEELSIIIKKLLTTQYSLNFLINKYKKKAKADNNLVSSELAEIWKREKLSKEDYLSRPQKITNYLLGQIKKSFPNSSVQEINIIIEQFMKKNN